MKCGFSPTSRFSVIRITALAWSLVIACADGRATALAFQSEGASVPGDSPSACIARWQTSGAAAPGSPRDTDCDGLSDSEENRWQLDPYNRDTDGDGIGDGDEFYDRYAVSDPSRWDSDYDGLGDGQEVFNIGTDPWDWDTDGDGRGDGEEISTGSNPLLVGR